MIIVELENYGSLTLCKSMCDGGRLAEPYHGGIECHIRSHLLSRE